MKDSEHKTVSEHYGSAIVPQFLGAFARLLKDTISLLMSVCLSVCLFIRPSTWNNSTPNERILIKFDI